MLAGLSIFHIAALHQYGSTNPLGVNTQTSTIPFGPYFGTKDLLGVLFLLLVFAILVFFYPDLLGHVAVLVGNNHYYDSAVCWNSLSIFTTRDVSLVVLKCALQPSQDWVAAHTYKSRSPSVTQVCAATKGRPALLSLLKRAGQTLSYN